MMSNVRKELNEIKLKAQLKQPSPTIHIRNKEGDSTWKRKQEENPGDWFISFTGRS